MAQRRYTIVFYAAVFIAAMATYGVYRVLQAAKMSSRVATKPVVVAAKDIPAGAALDEQSLEVKQWPAVTVPKEAFGSLEAAVGRVARVPVFTGEAIVPGRLARAGTAPGLEARITPGMRAMSVRINDVAGMSGLVQPNSRVDVLVSLRESGSSGSEEVSKLFLENMRVLSMGSRTTRDDTGDPTPATTATLEVTPTQAEKLAVAMRQGMIQLVLRGFDDTDSTNTKGSSSSEVLAQLRDAKPAPVVAQAPSRQRSTPRRQPQPERTVPPPVAVAPPVAKPDSLTVRVYRGNQVTQQKFQVDTANGNRTP
ncbi:MAG TPA: Flp pilus assembly protein CpaB [Gemmatimonadaceae bacterium]|nr:Flp pilus assembly protein CpaB [Gemmatimonadaceae bacterium]